MKFCPRCNYPLKIVRDKNNGILMYRCKECGYTRVEQPEAENVSKVQEWDKGMIKEGRR
jgi:DNA-directed RNA polymerase subunit M/transcription elongation factor TFIIS